VPDTGNWVAGLVLTWPILDMFWSGARLDVARADETTARAQKREIEVAVQSQIERARAILDGAKKVATNTPIALAAARNAEQQASARYQSGLAAVTEVADAERVLTQAEIDDADARLGVRSAQLLLARALGDLEPFLAEVR
jgi:outer membrane protein TolC